MREKVDFAGIWDSSIVRPKVVMRDAHSALNSLQSRSFGSSVQFWTTSNFHIYAACHFGRLMMNISFQQLSRDPDYT